MSHFNAPEPESHGDGQPGRAPQVAVRDGDRLLCPCCGEVLMKPKETPTGEKTSKKFAFPKMNKVKGDPRRTWPSLERLIAKQEAQERGEDKIAKPEEVPQMEPTRKEPEFSYPCYRADPIIVPIDPEVVAYEFPEVDPPQIPKPVKPTELRVPELDLRYRPPRDWNTRYDERVRRRSKKPLRDPFTHDGARLFAWMYYRMKLLDLQLHREICTKQEEIDQLQAALDGVKQKPQSEAPVGAQQAAHTHSCARVDDATVTRRDPRTPYTTERSVHANASVAPKDETLTSTSDCHFLSASEFQTLSSESQERGPP